MSSKEITIDVAGRLVVPKSLRDRAGIRPGMKLEIRWREGRIEIEPAPREVRLKRRGKMLVAEPVEPSDRLSTEDVERTVDELRSRHAEG